MRDARSGDAVVEQLQTGLTQSWSTFKDDLFQELHRTDQSTATLARIQHELDVAKEQLEAAQALSALRAIHHQQALDAQAAASALQLEKLQREVARLTAKANLDHPRFCSSHQVLADTQEQLAAAYDLAALQATRHAQRLDSQAASGHLQVDGLQNEVARLTAELSQLRHRISPHYLSRPAEAAAGIDQGDDDTLRQYTELLTLRHEQTLNHSRAEYQLKEKAFTRQIIQLRIKLAAATTFYRALLDAPTALSATIPYDDVNNIIELLKSSHEQALQQQRDASSLKQRALLKRCFRLAISAVRSRHDIVNPANVTPSILQCDVQQVLNFQQDQLKQTRDQLKHAEISQVKTAENLDSTNREYSTFRATQQDKEQRMDARIQELTHALFLINERTNGLTVSTAKEINLIAKRGLGLEDCLSQEGDQDIAG